MDWQTLAAQLFPQGHDIVEREFFLSGTARVNGETVAVIGTTGHTSIGVEIALAQAQAVLQTVRDHPQRPIVILVDTQGQRLRYRDEMLGINSYMAHLGKCIDLARRHGHKIIGLVYDQALSGGFITSGLVADACYALPEATIRVMGLPAMARITKVPEETLVELAKAKSGVCARPGKLFAHGRHRGDLGKRPCRAPGAGHYCRRPGRSTQRAGLVARRPQAGAARHGCGDRGRPCPRGINSSGYPMRDGRLRWRTPAPVRH